MEPALLPRARGRRMTLPSGDAADPAAPVRDRARRATRRRSTFHSPRRTSAVEPGGQVGRRFFLPRALGPRAPPFTLPQSRTSSPRRPSCSPPQVMPPEVIERPPLPGPVRDLDKGARPPPPLESHRSSTRETALRRSVALACPAQAPISIEPRLGRTGPQRRTASWNQTGSESPNSCEVSGAVKKSPDRPMTRSLPTTALFPFVLVAGAPSS